MHLASSLTKTSDNWRSYSQLYKQLIDILKVSRHPTAAPAKLCLLTSSARGSPTTISDPSFWHWRIDTFRPTCYIRHGCGMLLSAWHKMAQHTQWECVNPKRSFQHYGWINEGNTTWKRITSEIPHELWRSKLTISKWTSNNKNIANLGIFVWDKWWG